MFVRTRTYCVDAFFTENWFKACPTQGARRRGQILWIQRGQLSLPTLAVLLRMSEHVIYLEYTRLGTNLPTQDAMRVSVKNRGQLATKLNYVNIFSIVPWKHIAALWLVSFTSLLCLNY